MTYNLRWKGLIPKAESASMPFVCKDNTHGQLFYYFQQRRFYQQDLQNVTAEGGLFVPPESGLDWSKLMLDLNPNDDYYPFPDPDL